MKQHYSSYPPLNQHNMNYIAKIKQLYALPENEHSGFTEGEIYEVENRLNIVFPFELKNYYLTLGKVDVINNSYNRLLNPSQEIRFSNDNYLVFYEENQAVVYWGIKEKDLKLTNPPVWGNYGTEEHPDWYLEANTTDNFFLLMAIYNGTLGGLKYNANFLDIIEPKTVRFIENKWTKLTAVSYDKQKIYTNHFDEVLSLSFDEENNCTAIFIGTNKQEGFDEILNILDLDWSYTSYEDEDNEN